MRRERKRKGAGLRRGGSTAVGGESDKPWTMVLQLCYCSGRCPGEVAEARLERCCCFGGTHYRGHRLSVEGGDGWVGGEGRERRKCERVKV